MKVESIAECSTWSILHYFRPELSDNWYWKPAFSLFESGRITQVLLYTDTPSLILGPNICSSQESGSESQFKIEKGCIQFVEKKPIYELILIT